MYKSFSHDIIRIMLPHRCQNSSLTSFHDRRGNLLSDICTVDVVLGDFNIDILNSPNFSLKPVLFSK